MERSIRGVPQLPLLDLRDQDGFLEQLPGQLVIALLLGRHLSGHLERSGKDLG
ncbi:MAG TPA: hypothetical protein VH682_16225 [Gemmataceae bacterium]